ncbi:MAG: glucosaminidase domain-containing protein [Gammaproteobacteria bacterium]|nr:glucosaminidase domain-containing protein [Gammaproteobacteria bacterium]
MNRYLYHAIATALLVGIALLAWWLFAERDEAGEIAIVGEAPELRGMEPDSAEELLRRFEELDYEWPPGGPVPALAIRSLPDDMNELRVQDKKSAFFRSLAPMIAAENAVLRREREFLQQVFADPGRLEDIETRAKVEALAVRYKVAGEPTDSRFQRKLLTHVDVVPPGLILAQAANESAWGTSRFARQANNLFGIWTWNKDKGLEPLRRDPDATHFVRIYSDLQAAIRNYLYTINIGGAYEQLRQLRADMREANKPLDPIVLAGGLEKYSERGEAYVEEIRSMITYNKLDDLRRFELRDGTGAASP